MTDDDRAEFLALLTGSASVYGRRLSETALDAYWSDLYPFPLTAIRAAFVAHRRTPGAGKQFPTPAHLLELLEGLAEDRAQVAWRVLVSTAGQYDHVVLDDPVAAAVVRQIGGWGHIGRCNERELPFLQREFTRRYVVLSRNPPTQSMPLVYDRGLAGTMALPAPLYLDLHDVGDLDLTLPMLEHDTNPH